MSAKNQFRNEILNVIRRWSMESDITLGDMLLGIHEATTIVINAGGGPEDDKEDRLMPA